METFICEDLVNGKGECSRRQTLCPLLSQGTSIARRGERHKLLAEPQMRHDGDLLRHFGDSEECNSYHKEREETGVRALPYLDGHYRNLAERMQDSRDNPKSTVTLADRDPNEGNPGYVDENR